MVLHIALPLLLGWRFYVAEWNSPLLRNHLPDGLWAYSFTALMLLIWENNIHSVWLFIMIVFFAGFEMMQYFHVLRGTGDFVDFIVYLCFSALAILFTNIKNRTT